MKFEGLFGFSGLRGSGKTLSVALRINKNINHKSFKRDPTKRIWTNTPLQFPNFPQRKIIYWEEPQEIENIRNGILFIDEAHKYFPARGWQDFSPVFFDLITQSRHYDITIYFTTQDIDQIDINIRRNIERLYFCQEILKIPKLFFAYKTIELDTSIYHKQLDHSEKLEHKILGTKYNLFDLRPKHIKEYYDTKYYTGNKTHIIWSKMTMGKLKTIVRPATKPPRA